MSKKQETWVVMALALVGSAYLGKVAKQQGAALGLSALAVSVVGAFVGMAIA
ncbi:hypothetical protein AB0D30_21095 [Streptomyces sp. NPDC048409]|uniref:hypothetical protein n=1 Tax=Streptomyces sp. NPDC048409 TaxID=3154723 RepID=UPI003440E34B